MSLIAAALHIRIESWLNDLPALLLLAVGIPLMLWGADRLVSGSVSLARRLGISTIIIGLTVVSAGTSAPELVVNLIAATGGNPGLGFGNVVGSNIANIGLVVGIGALIMPMRVHSRVIRSELPWLTGISIGAILLVFIPIGRVTGSDGERFQLGFSTLEGIALSIAFLVITYLWYRACKAPSSDPISREVEDATRDAGDHSLTGAVALFLIGLTCLLIGGKFTEVGAVRIASSLGLSNAVIGMTVVAVATSLPELTTTIVAARRGHADLAIGNIVGSNIFNILFVLGITSTVAPIPLPANGLQDLLAMLAFTLLLWRMCVTNRLKVVRREGGILLAIYLIYIAWGLIREIA